MRFASKKWRIIKAFLHLLLFSKLEDAELIKKDTKRDLPVSPGLKSRK